MLICFGLPAAAVAGMHTEDSCAVRGLRMMQLLKYSDAVSVFDICLVSDHSNAQLYFHRGTCYLLMHKPNMALVDYNMASRLDSGLYEVYYNRGLAHQALGNFTFAEADFVLYSTRVPSDIKVLRNLAILMEQLQDYASAIAYYSRYLAKLPEPDEQKGIEAEYREILLARASAHAENDSIALAVQDLNTCISFRQDDTAVWMAKGNMFYNARMFAEAIDAYNVILLMYPANKAALVNRADAYTATGRFEEALRDYQILSSGDRYNSEYYFNAGFCQLQLNTNEEALLSFGKALDTEYPNLGLLLTLRGVAYHNLHMLQEACSDWNKAMQAGNADAGSYKKAHCK